MDDKLFIILLNYNGYEDTINCIASIKKSKNVKNYEIILVDNKSTDDSVQYLKAINGIIFIESPENNGFASGNNIGIKYALENNAKYILLLNTDTEIDQYAISIMMDKIKKNSRVGIVGSRIMYYSDPERINYCGGDIDWYKCKPIHNHYKEIYNKQKEEEHLYTNFITGCCMLIKREVFENIGLLSEEYFMYYEDVDFCVRSTNAGYKLELATDSIIFHKVSASSGGEDSPFSIKWMTRNRILFMKKFKSQTKGIITQVFFYTSRILKAILYISTGKTNLFKAMMQGIRDGRRIKL